MNCKALVTTLPFVSLCAMACSGGEGDENQSSFGDEISSSGTVDDTETETGAETETESGSGESTTAAQTETETDAGTTCGDALVEGSEECDLGSDNADDGECTTACTAAVCGDGYVWADNEECDGAGETAECDVDCTPVACGDGVANVSAGEECDDSGESASCNDDCSAAACGDGITNVSAGEECDDANMDDTDACVSGCVGAVCGDGYVWADNETCDDANMDENDGCLSICTNPLPSCKDYLDAAPDAMDGYYTIDPDGEGVIEPFEVFCDMTTDGGGWTLILNRVVDSDNAGQPDLDATVGVPDALRETNWQLDIGLFWAGAADVVFADKENASCEECTIADYDTALKVPRPGAAAWSKSCPGASAVVPATKLVGLAGNGSTYQCGASLGWGSCSGSVCHYGTHSTNTASDGSWSQNGWNEVHFPANYSSYASYGNYAAPPSAWCRSCGGGLEETFNGSTTCCGAQTNNASSRWTIWVR